MRVLAVALAFALLAALPVVTPPAEAGHWCAETRVTVVPTIVTAGISETFNITLENLGLNNTQLTSIEIQLDWRQTPWIFGARTLNASTERGFSIGVNDVPAGTHTVTVTFTGTNDADPPSQVTTCEATRTVTSFGTGEGIFSGIVNTLLIILGIVIAAVVVIIVVVVVMSRKKKAPPPPPQTAAPTYYPPQAPPPGPPTAPPPSNP